MKHIYMEVEAMKILTTPRMARGYGPAAVEIPKRLQEVITVKGPVGGDVMNCINLGYRKAIVELGQKGAEGINV